MFLAADGTRVTFQTITETRPGFPGNNPEGDMGLQRSDCTNWPPSYRVVKTQLAAYSCEKGNTVIYHAARYNGSGSVILHATYPEARAAIRDRVIARMSASMRQVTRREGWR